MVTEDNVCIKVFRDIVEVLELSPIVIFDAKDLSPNDYGIYRTSSKKSLCVNTALGVIWLRLNDNEIEAILPPALIDHYPSKWNRELLIKTVSGSLQTDILDLKYRLENVNSNVEREISPISNYSTYFIVLSVVIVLGWVGYTYIF